MNIFFRVDANTEIGVGHLMRCLALAQALTEMKANVVFLVSAATLPICKARHDWVGQVRVVPTLPQEQELQWLAEQADALPADIIILDGYQFQATYRAGLKQLFPYLVVLDDLNNSGDLHADVLVNPAEQAKNLDYHATATNARLCLGSGYRLLRQEFVEQAPNDWRQRQDLVICYGGSDPNGYTLSTLVALQRVGVSMPIRVITGPAFAELDVLTRWLTKTDLIIQHVHDCQQMADVFNHAKFVISAAGGTQYELLATATPSLFVVVAENQALAVQACLQQGWCQIQDARQGFAADEVVDKVLNLLKSEETLVQMHHKALLHKPVSGAYRVAEEIRQLII